MNNNTFKFEVYPVPMVAQLLGKSKKRIYQLIKSGKMPKATPDELQQAGINIEYVGSTRIFVSRAGIEEYLRYKRSYDEAIEAEKAFHENERALKSKGGENESSEDI